MSASIDQLARVVITDDRLSAELVLGAGIDRGEVTRDALRAIAAGAGLASHADLDQKLRDAADAYAKSPGQKHAFTIATGTAPEHGRDGTFILDRDIDAALSEAAIVAQKRRAIAEDAKLSADEHGNVDFYNKSAFVVVEPGTVIGTLTLPTKGVDGVDVLGRNLAAKDGKPVSIKFDPAIMVDDQTGTVISRAHGRLDVTREAVRIAGEIVIDDAVDFHTGNIRFPRDVTVHGGVCDRFEVSAGRHLTVKKLVEAAHLVSGGDMTLSGGMTGRGKGTIRCGGNLHAAYLDDVRAEVHGPLAISREAKSCEISVLGRVESPGAVIVGGELFVSGGGEVGQLGTPGGTPTLVVLGRLRSLEDVAVRALEFLPELQDRAEKAESRLAALQSIGGKMSAHQAEELTELQFAQIDAKAKIGPLTKKLLVVLETIASHSSSELVVRRSVHAGVSFWIGQWRIDMRSDLRGPVRLSLSEHGEPIATDLTSGSDVPLKNLAKVYHDTRFVDLSEIRRQVEQARAA